MTIECLFETKRGRFSFPRDGEVPSAILGKCDSLGEVQEIPTVVTITEQASMTALGIKIMYEQTTNLQ